MKVLPLPGFEKRYLITSSGSVFSKSYMTKSDKKHPHNRHLHRGRWLKQSMDQKGYCMITLAGNTRRVHLLVAAAFIPNPDSLPRINHIDGIKHNNDVSNLEWCTDSQNTLHAYRIGLMKPRPGENNPAAKLTWDEVSEIRRLYVEGSSQYALARTFGVRQAQISLIVNNKKWNSEPDQNSMKRLRVRTIKWEQPLAA